jgi:putative membrane protein
MSWIIEFLICAAAFLGGAQLLRGVHIESYVQALMVVVVVAVLDMTLGTVLKIVTLGILSLGVFNWFLNALLIQVADWFLPEFKVDNFWWALGLAGFVSIATGVAGYFI